MTDEEKLAFIKELSDPKAKGCPKNCPKFSADKSGCGLNACMDVIYKICEE